MPSMVEGYMKWDASRGPAGLDNMKEHCPSDEEPQQHTVFVVDMFCAFRSFFHAVIAETLS